jgi:hypothetical protein
MINILLDCGIQDFKSPSKLNPVLCSSLFFQKVSTDVKISPWLLSWPHIYLVFRTRSSRPLEFSWLPLGTTLKTWKVSFQRLPDKESINSWVTSSSWYQICTHNLLLYTLCFFIWQICLLWNKGHKSDRKAHRSSRSSWLGFSKRRPISIWLVSTVCKWRSVASRAGRRECWLLEIPRMN